LFARERGIRILESLLEDERFSIAGVLVHSNLRSFEDPNRGMCPTFTRYQEIAKSKKIPISTVDTKQEGEKLEFLRDLDPFDFLITCSWRYLVSKEIFSQAKIGAINIHRGKLPNYSGDFPVRRALQNNEKSIVLTVHKMTEKIDVGEILAEKRHDVHLVNSETIENATERIKKEMLPLYPMAIIESINMLVDSFEIEKV